MECFKHLRTLMIKENKTNEFQNLFHNFTDDGHNIITTFLNTVNSGILNFGNIYLSLKDEIIEFIILMKTRLNVTSCLFEDIIPSILTKYQLKRLIKLNYMPTPLIFHCRKRDREFSFKCKPT
jgi:hypothetical protein